jgi:hypothetical protein
VNDNPDGILGNLPRSRPGVRSEKRAAEGAPPKRTPPKPKATATAAKPRATKAKSTAPEPDSLERAVRLAGDVAETGIKVAAKVAGGVLRRLPRP